MTDDTPPINPTPPPPPAAMPPPPAGGHPDQSTAILSIVLSSIGILAVCCAFAVPFGAWLGIPLSIAGLIIGRQERAAVQSGAKPAELEGITKTAVVLGWVAIGVNIVIILLILVGVAALGGLALLDSVG